MRQFAWYELRYREINWTFKIFLYTFLHLAAGYIFETNIYSKGTLEGTIKFGLMLASINVLHKFSWKALETNFYEIRGGVEFPDK